MSESRGKGRWEAALLLCQLTVAAAFPPSLLHISCCGDECEFLLKNGKYKIKTCQQRKEIKNERGKREERKKSR